MFIRDASGRAWQVDISEEADAGYKLLNSTTDYLLLTIEDRTGDAFLCFAPDGKLNISAESASLPIEIRQEFVPAVETVWPPFEYKQATRLHSSIPESFKYKSALFPEGLDEASLEATNQLILQWRSGTLEPLLHMGAQVNQRSRRLLDFIVRMQGMQERLDVKLLGHRIKGMYHEGVVDKRYAEVEHAVRGVEEGVERCEGRVQDLELFGRDTKGIGAEIETLDRELREMRDKIGGKARIV